MIPFIRRGEIDYLSKSVSWKGKTKTLKAAKRADNAFDGKVYVLINGLTYSNGAVLARYLKEYADATIIGEEAGTRYEGFTAGSHEYVNLPNSGLRIGIPNYAKIFPESKIQNPPNRGLMPDIEKSDSIDEMISEEDEWREFILDLLRKEDK